MTTTWLVTTEYITVNTYEENIASLTVIGWQRD